MCEYVTSPYRCATCKDLLDNFILEFNLEILPGQPFVPKLQQYSAHWKALVTYDAV